MPGRDRSTSEGGPYEPVDPDAVLRQRFSTTRRGYDPLEVQTCLMALASDIRAGRERERELARRLERAERAVARLRAEVAGTGQTVEVGAVPDGGVADVAPKARDAPVAPVVPVAPDTGAGAGGRAFGVPAAPAPREGRHSSAVRVIRREPRSQEPEPEPEPAEPELAEPEPDPEPAEVEGPAEVGGSVSRLGGDPGAETGHVDPVPEWSSRGRLTALFTRIRDDAKEAPAALAVRAAAGEVVVAHETAATPTSATQQAARSVSVPGSAPPSDVAGSPVGDAQFADEIVRVLARALKRALTEEMNEVLDRLRCASEPVRASELLRSYPDHLERYRAVAVGAIPPTVPACSAAALVERAVAGLEPLHAELVEVLDPGGRSSAGYRSEGRPGRSEGKRVEGRGVEDGVRAAYRRARARVGDLG